MALPRFVHKIAEIIRAILTSDLMLLKLYDFYKSELYSGIKICFILVSGNNFIPHLDDHYEAASNNILYLTENYLYY